MSLAEPTRNEKAGLFVTVMSVAFPALIVCGFAPDFDVLPYVGWLVIAGGGAALGIALYTREWVHGAVAGGLIGCGALLGIEGYIAARDLLIRSDTFLDWELLIGACVGAIPGFVYLTLMRRARRRARHLPRRPRRSRTG